MEPIIIENLQVWPEDLGKMNWHDSMERVKELGEGWRLPTKEEFEDILYPNRTKIPELKEELYWSSSELNYSNAWYFSFLNGPDYLYNKKSTLYVRAVRDFTADEALRYLLKEF